MEFCTDKTIINIHKRKLYTDENITTYTLFYNFKFTNIRWYKTSIYIGMWTDNTSDLTDIS